MMHFDWFGNIPDMLFPFATFVFVVFRLRGRRRTGKRLRFRRSGVAVGNALQTLHVFVDPGVRYVIAEQLRERTDEDGDEDLADPAKHLERQLRRIRRGEEVDRLTILIGRKE